MEIAVRIEFLSIDSKILRDFFFRNIPLSCNYYFDGGENKPTVPTNKGTISEYLYPNIRVNLYHKQQVGSSFKIKKTYLNFKMLKSILVYSLMSINLPN